MSTTLLRGIGLLATQDDELGETDRRRDRARRRPDRLGRPGRRRRRPPTPASTSAGGACCPGSSTRTPTWSSPATAAAEFAARMAGRAVRGRWHPHHGRRDPGGHRRRCCGRTWPGWPPSCCTRASRRSRRKSGYGLTPRPRQRSLRIAAEFTPETTFLGAHVVPGRRRPRRLPRRGHRRRCWTPARRTPAGSTCSASGAPSTSTRAARCLRAGQAAGSARGVHANQLSAGAGRAARRRAGRGQRRPLHAPHAPPTSTRWRSRRRWPRCCRCAEFSTRSPYPDARAAARRRRPPSRWPPTATRARRTRRRCRLRSRWRCARCG